MASASFVERNSHRNTILEDTRRSHVPLDRVEYFREMLCTEEEVWSRGGRGHVSQLISFPKPSLGVLGQDGLYTSRWKAHTWFRILTSNDAWSCSMILQPNPSPSFSCYSPILLYFLFLDFFLFFLITNVSCRMGDPRCYCRLLYAGWWPSFWMDDYMKRVYLQSLNIWLVLLMPSCFGVLSCLYLFSGFYKLPLDIKVNWEF